MQNLISERVADFLKNYPPFNEMLEKDLGSLSEEVSIIYKEKGSDIFSEGEAPHPHFYVVHKGAVSLNRKDTDEIMDICDEGDIFGLRPLMANENYKLDASAFEESILYAIPIASFRPFAQTYEEVSNFLIESFASNTRNPYAKRSSGRLLSDTKNTTTLSQGSGLLDLQAVKIKKKLVSCTPQTDAGTVARLMTRKKVGSVLVVNEDFLPLGIITDKDLRNTIVTGKLPVSATAENIMTTPVITYPEKLTVTQAQMAMMKNDIGHICLTEDGTPNTKAVGIISKHDVMLAVGNNPAVLMKEIKWAKKIKQIRSIRKSVMMLLKAYLEDNIPMSITMQVISELNDACVKQLISIALKKMPSEPPVGFSWVAMGSQGRGEQLLHTDQDNAIIFEDVEEERLPEVTNYFLELARRVTKGLRTIGYEYCPADMMASNPKWCLSLTEWKNLVSHWIINPGKDEVLLSSIFFDYNHTYGDRSLVNALADHIFDSVKKYPIFYMHLASGALQNPSPTGFFRQFLLEQDGQYKDFFDLKRRALMPLTDGARVLILSHQIKSINNTAKRYEKLAELEPNNREFFLSCSYATKALLKFRAKQGILHNDSGRFIALETLTKEEKIKLKRTFKTIKELQELISVRFKVSNILG
ncbi:DUF294 nucleotidyltransferase-like domain-containing protein [Poritiphilus flavus]|uniref:CBS domain-containing protein n=1 Tax=Poritiphilus flavus TaxID=2697053 RepID=A0A6L9EEC7_9FLAO|nr:DUF294 nucleotidyltransferase-like domain-containing protein [Poritiphilus flavus]NAS12942.1 CBS domain-containing protein [Poritiphilus flavus]